MLLFPAEPKVGRNVRIMFYWNSLFSYTRVSCALIARIYLPCAPWAIYVSCMCRNQKHRLAVIVYKTSNLSEWTSVKSPQRRAYVGGMLLANLWNCLLILCVALRCRFGDVMDCYLWGRSSQRWWRVLLYRSSSLGLLNHASTPATGLGPQAVSLPPCPSLSSARLSLPLPLPHPEEKSRPRSLPRSKPWFRREFDHRVLNVNVENDLLRWRNARSQWTGRFDQLVSQMKVTFVWFNLGGKNVKVKYAIPTIVFHWLGKQLFPVFFFVRFVGLIK